MNPRDITELLNQFPAKDLASVEGTHKKFSTWQQLLAAERLPLALVDLTSFDDNLNKVISIAKQCNKNIRIATKSIRVPELILRVLKKGWPVLGVMCYTVDEAAYLYDLGINDLLIAYPSMQKSDLIKLRNMQMLGADVALVLDSEEHLKLIDVTLKELDKQAQYPLPPLRIVVEVDMSLRFFSGYLHFGVRRSPLRSVSDLQHLLQKSNQYTSTKIVGVMAYEAIIAGLPDHNPFNRFLNPIKTWIRNSALRYIEELRAKIPAIFHEAGLSLEIFNGGGTGSINYSLCDRSLTEVTIGSGLLCPHLFDYYSNLNSTFKFDPALFFALPGIRSSDAGFITCLGGGYIASGPPGWDKLPIPVYPPGLKVLGTEGCGEVQTPLRMSREATSLLGKLIFFRPAKSGELAEHFNEYYLIQNLQVEGRAKTYRGLGQCFL